MFELCEDQPVPPGGATWQNKRRIFFSCCWTEYGALFLSEAPVSLVDAAECNRSAAYSGAISAGMFCARAATSVCHVGHTHKTHTHTSPTFYISLALYKILASMSCDSLTRAHKCHEAKTGRSLLILDFSPSLISSLTLCGSNSDPPAGREQWWFYKEKKTSNNLKIIFSCQLFDGSWHCGVILLFSWIF